MGVGPSITQSLLAAKLLQHMRLCATVICASLQGLSPAPLEGCLRYLTLRSTNTCVCWNLAFVLYDQEQKAIFVQKSYEFSINFRVNLKICIRLASANSHAQICNPPRYAMDARPKRRRKDETEWYSAAKNYKERKQTQLKQLTVPFPETPNAELEGPLAKEKKRRSVAAMPFKKCSMQPKTRLIPPRPPYRFPCSRGFAAMFKCSLSNSPTPNQPTSHESPQTPGAVYQRVLCKTLKQ